MRNIACSTAHTRAFLRQTGGNKQQLEGDFGKLGTDYQNKPPLHIIFMICLFVPNMQVKTVDVTSNLILKTNLSTQLLKLCTWLNSTLPTDTKKQMNDCASYRKKVWWRHCVTLKTRSSNPNRFKIFFSVQSITCSHLSSPKWIHLYSLSGNACYLLLCATSVSVRFLWSCSKYGLLTPLNLFPQDVVFSICPCKSHIEGLRKSPN